MDIDVPYPHMTRQSLRMSLRYRATLYADDANAREPSSYERASFASYSTLSKTINTT